MKNIVSKYTASALTAGLAHLGFPEELVGPPVEAAIEAVGNVWCRAVDTHRRDLREQAVQNGQKHNPLVFWKIVAGSGGTQSKSEEEIFFRVLRGELESPGSTSKRLVDTITRMDCEEAELFLKAASFALGAPGNKVLWRPDVIWSPITDDERVRLSEAELLRIWSASQIAWEDQEPRSDFNLGPVTIVNPTNDTISFGHNKGDRFTLVGSRLFDVLGDAIQPSPTIKDSIKAFVKSVDERLEVIERTTP